MARPRLELLARHAAVLFVEVVTDSNGRNKSVNENRRSEILLGAHMSRSGGVHTAIERGCLIKCTPIQMFAKNNMQRFARPLTRPGIRALCDHVQHRHLLSIFSHANYLAKL